MNHEDAIIERFHAIFRDLRPHDLARIELDVTARERGSPIDMTLVLRPQNRSDARSVLLSFRGVTNLRFNPASSGLYFGLLEIRSRRDRQWEDLNYEVFDAEQDNDIS